MINETDLQAFGYWSPTEVTVDFNTQTIPKMVDEFRVTMGQEKDRYLSATLVNEEFDEWIHALFHKNKEEEIKELADLVYVIYNYANVLGWDLDEAVRRVHKNNLERCIQPDGSIQRRADGKVLKNPNAKKVYLEDLV